MECLGSNGVQGNHGDRSLQDFFCIPSRRQLLVRDHAGDTVDKISMVIGKEKCGCRGQLLMAGNEYNVHINGNTA